MSCVVAISENGVVWMGSDSLFVSVGDFAKKRTEANSKIFRKDGLLIGWVGSRRFGDILQWNFNFPKFEDGRDFHEYLASDFVSSLLDTLQNLKHVEFRDGEALSYTFIIGRKGKIFQIHSDFSVSVLGDGYDACGSGDQLAMAALEGMKGLSLTPEEKISRALQIVSKFTANVGPPFHVICEDENG